MDGMDLPFLIPPFPYGHVEEDVYRGGYPKLRNLRFLKRLKLKTIVSLTPDPINYDGFSKFCKEQNIENIHIRVAKPKDSLPLTYSKVAQVIQLIIDPNKLPIYVHCLDGSIITGVIFMCFRKLQLWASHNIQLEYIRYTRDDDIGNEEIEFLEKYNGEIEIPEQIPRWLWNGQIPFKKHPTMKIRFSRNNNNLENKKGLVSNTNNQNESQNDSNMKNNSNIDTSNDNQNNIRSVFSNEDSNINHKNEDNYDIISKKDSSSKSTSNKDTVNNNNDKNKYIIEDQFTEAIRKRIDEEILAIRKSSKYGNINDDHSGISFMRNNNKSISAKTSENSNNRRSNQRYKSESEQKDGISLNNTNTNSEYESNDDLFDSYSSQSDESDDEDSSDNENNKNSIYNDMNDDDNVNDNMENKEENEQTYDYNNGNNNDKNYGIDNMSMTLKALNLEGFNSHQNY